MHAATAQRQDAVIAAGDKPGVVRRHQYGHADAVEFFKQAQNAFRQRVIRVTGRFIRQQHRRLVHHRTGDAHALLLTAGQLNREVFRFIQQTDLVQRGGNAAADIFGAGAGDDQRHRHVVIHRAIQQQVVIPEDHADLPTQERHLAVFKRLMS